MNVIIGNIIALIASLLMVYIGILNKKEKIIYLQSIQIGMFVLSNLILGGITGAIVNGISLVRNILCYKDRLKTKEKVILIVLSLILSLSLNNLVWIGTFPLISMAVYTFFIDIKNVVKFKIMSIFSVLLWFIYDIYILSYVSAIFDFLCIITNSIAIYQLCRLNKIYK